MSPSKTVVEVLTRAPIISHPLVLVSQIQRSGGSFLAQLFDGHPELCAHPDEIQIGYPTKWDWPNLDLNWHWTVWFNLLFEKHTLIFIAQGYSKSGRNPHARALKYPFDFSVERQAAIFLEAISRHGAMTQRQILNCYFTSYFEALENWHASRRERFITGFTPRVIMHRESLERFNRDYPDGKIISLLRDPRSWFASSSRNNSMHTNVQFAISEWMESANAADTLQRRDPSRCLFVVFEDLVRDTESEMRRIADFIGISFDSCLLTPTYLGLPMRPNSMFAIKEFGVNQAMIDRRDKVANENLAYIERTAMPIYHRLVEAHRAGRL